MNVPTDLPQQSMPVENHVMGHADVSMVESLAVEAADVYLRCISYDDSAEAIAERVNVSPILRRNILDEANSTLSHAQPRIDSVSEAIARIGQRKVSELALETPSCPGDGP